VTSDDTTTGAATAPVLRLSGITKRFGALTANDGISLDLQAGEVLALLGENGAGKSTLMSILFGHYTADAGHILVHGRPLPPGQPRAALAAGIGMVHQHSTLADNLTVLDNVMLGTEPLWQPFTRRRAARERLLAVAQRFGLTVQPEARVGTLSVGERQRVEILKALYRDARILILDEPTAVLTPQESEALFDTLGQMVAQGLAIIFISHKLGEVLRVSHRVAVLRAGRLVAQARAADTDAATLAQWMVGQTVARTERHPAEHRTARWSARCGAWAPRATRANSCTTSTWTCVPARSWRWPASPATARWRWPSCCAAPAAPAAAPSRWPASPARRAGLAGAAGRGPHSRRPPRHRRGGRPAGVGERGGRALCRTPLLALGLGAPAGGPGPRRATGARVRRARRRP
jgi:simple sugar transport system ATP-binding protein